MLGGKGRDLVQVPKSPSRVARLEIPVERQIAGRRLDAGLNVRAIEEQCAAGVQNPAGASHQPFGRGPRRNVDHVDVDDGIGPLDRPCVREGSVKLQWREQVGQSSMLAPSRDTGQGTRIRVGRLPLQVRQGGGVIDGMFAGAGRDFQHDAALRQSGLQHLQDRIAVARRRG
jgi:hypothetical protein